MRLLPCNHIVFVYCIYAVPKRSNEAVDSEDVAFYKEAINDESHHGT